MTVAEHPIRNLDLRAYSNPDHGWIAQFGNGRAFPIVFRAATFSEVKDKAETFRFDVLKKYEAKFVARKQAAARAKRTRDAKKQITEDA